LLLKDNRLGTKRTLAILAVFSLIYFLDATLLASEKYFWFDELCTVHVDRLSTFGQAQQAIEHGVDWNPPLFHLLTRLAGGPFGYGLISTRLPEMVGFWVLCICLFLIVERRFGTASGVVAMLLPLLTSAKFYAYEARPSGLVLGFAGLAALAWQRIPLTRYRRWCVAVFGISLVAAFLSHGYALTLGFPFCVAELYRSYRRGRLDWTLWCSMALAVLVSVPFLLPLVRNLRQGVGSSREFFFPPNWNSVSQFYQYLLSPAILLILAFFILFVLVRIYLPDAIPVAEQASIDLSSDVVLALGFLAIPAVTLILAVVSKGPFISRYMISAVIGVALIAGIGAGSLGRKPWLPISIAFVVACSFLIDTVRILKHRREGIGEILIEPSSMLRLETTPRNPLALNQIILSARESNLPIVILSPWEFSYLFEYSPNDIKQRLRYLTRNGTDLGTNLIQAARDWSGVNYDIAYEHDFLRSNSHFLVYGSPENTSAFLVNRKHATVQSVKAGEGPYSEEHVLAEVVLDQ
jgi:hypothetical protein